jgi:Ca2+-binding EF-hand superfamily protein
MPTKAELNIILQQAFVVYDVDKSGFLERPEIKKLLNDACTGLGAPPITDSLLDEVIKTVDDNGDGKFSFNELFKVLGQIIEHQMA